MDRSSLNLDKRFAAIFACFTILLIGSNVLIRAGSLSFEAVLHAFKLCIIGGVSVGLLGYLIGKVVQRPKKEIVKTVDPVKKEADKDLLIDDILLDDLNEDSDE